jgi:alpha-tubulin suppressor-like RCC1 family protein
VAAGWIHTLALASNGHVYAGGSDGYGQLGDGEPDWAQATPVELAQNVLSGIAAGEAHSIGY